MSFQFARLGFACQSSIPVRDSTSPSCLFLVVSRVLVAFVRPVPSLVLTLATRACFQVRSFAETRAIRRVTWQSTRSKHVVRQGSCAPMANLVCAQTIWGTVSSAGTKGAGRFERRFTGQYGGKRTCADEEKTADRGRRRAEGCRSATHVPKERFGRDQFAFVPVLGCDS